MIVKIPSRALTDARDSVLRRSVQRLLPNARHQEADIRPGLDLETAQRESLLILLTQQDKIKPHDILYQSVFPFPISLCIK